MIDCTNFTKIALTLENRFYIPIPVEYTGVVKTSAVYNDGERDCVNELVLSIRRGFYCAEDINEHKIDLQDLHITCDIVWIDIVYENSRKQALYVDCWEWGLHETNIFQYSKFNRYGDLFIAVSTDSSLLDREFPDAVINAGDYEVNKIKKRIAK